MYTKRNIKERSRIIVAVEKQQALLTGLCVHACVRGCGYPGSLACACAYVHVTLLIKHVTLKRHIVTSFVAPQSLPYFLTLFINGVIFGKMLLNIKCVFIFFTTFA